MRKVLAPMLAQDAEQVERESGEGRGDLKMDETEPAAGAVLDQEPVQQHEANDRRARKEREKAIAVSVAELKAKNRERARSGASPKQASAKS